MLRAIKKNWFLVGVVVAIILAKWEPYVGAKGGFLKPEITVKYFAVSLIFLASGLSLETKDLRQALLQVNIHIFVQSFTFIFFPLFVHVAVRVLQHTSYNKLLLDGLTVLSCMPPPVSSAVILTKATGGNEAAAIFNSAFGSFLGIFVTPALLLATVGLEGIVPAGDIFTQLNLTVVLPLACGQMLRTIYRQWLLCTNLPFRDISSGVLLFIIYNAFCDTFSQHDVKVDAVSLVIIVFLVVCLQVCLLFLVFYIATKPWLAYRPPDVVALMFCCTHKSLTLGIPILRIVFSKLDGLSVLTIPLLIYHPTQILLGGLLAPMLASWLSTTSRYRPHKSGFYSV